MPSHAYTQIPGHGLHAEGKPFIGDGRGGWTRPDWGIGYGLCSCGEASPEQLDSDAARKRWHREHKEQVIKAKLDWSPR